MKNNPFTHEEINLMSIYNADGTREGLRVSLVNGGDGSYSVYRIDLAK